MRVVYSSDQLLHSPLCEINRGVAGPPFETPERALGVLQAVTAAGLDPLEAPEPHPLAALQTVHDPGYLAFLGTAHAAWLALGRAGEALPLAFPIRTLRSDRPPKSLDGRLSFYAFDISTPITAGAFTAARAAADTALTGAARLARGGDRAVFSLCRPPGHHAGRDFYGGYCFLNNAALATERLLAEGAGRIAVLDVDYHHGNGTQAIFYDRAEVLYVSLHADPATDFPYFLGYADETGAGAGEGANLNLPLPPGADGAAFGDALGRALQAIGRHGPDALVVSLGLDGLDGDPLGGFRLQMEDYARLGARIAGLGLATLFVLEGGYAGARSGLAAARTLTAFEER